MKLEQFVTRLQGVTIDSNGYRALCPCHQDKKPSLSITAKNGKILVHCHAFCETPDILTAMGLSFKDLSENEKATTWQSELEDYFKMKIKALYTYTDDKGKYLYTKVRFENKNIRYVVVDEDNNTFKTSKPKGVHSLYNLPAALRAIKKGFPVYITEGEKDVNTLKKLGLTAVTAGGASDWKKEFARYFTGAKVIILPDNDEPGLKLKDEITKDLRPFAFSVKSVITSRTDKGDVSDYIAEGHTKEDLKALVDEETATVAPWVELTERKDGSVSKKINPGILKRCISDNLHYKTVDGVFYWYSDGVYRQIDKNAVKAKILAYMPDSLSSDNLLNNIYNLLLADFDHMAHETDFNKDEDYINFKNGLYSVNTGELKPHDPSFIYTRQINAEYEPNLKEAPTFTKYIHDLCTDKNGNIDVQKKLALAQWLGLAISNIAGYRTKKMLILYSPIGNTGKSQYLNLLNHLIGSEFISNVALQNMNEDKGRFAFAGIGQTRLIINGDNSKATVKDSSILKSLTGGDYIKSEGKGQAIKTVLFRGLISIACNDLPYIADDKGEHLYNRFLLIPCTHVLEEHERDTRLFDKMIHEIPAIVNFALAGLNTLVASNFIFAKPADTEEYLEEYRKNSDTVYSYLIEEGYRITKNPLDKISKKRLFNGYILYCSENERIPLKPRQFTERIEKLTGHKVHKTRFNNILDYYVLGIILSATEFESLTPEELNQLKNNTQEVINGWMKQG